MQVSIASSSPTTARVDLLVVGVLEGETRSGAAGAIRKALGAPFERLLSQADFTGKRDQSVDAATFGKLKAHRVLFVGLGQGPLGTVEVRTLAARGARAALGARAGTMAVVLPAVEGAERAAAEGVVLGGYRFAKYMTGERAPKVELEKVTLLAQKGPTPAQRGHVDLGVRVGRAVTIARDLINEPPNELFPEKLAKFAADLAKERGLKATVFDRAALAKKGMNLILAVGDGSSRKPALAHLTYTPKGVKNPKKLVFVGKGITFDSGGLCIKPAPGMEEMKGDMGGAANVVALMAAVAELQPAIEVHGIIACAENMPDGAAYRPADIFKSFDGKTVEIINTDAEGRLVLADALAYARSLEPDLVVDNATLTGACVVALGTTVSAFYSNRDEVAERMKTCAREAGEAMWHMPLVEDLKDGLKSDWADLKHTADRWGGSITAALFLREFVGDVPWVHLDIAGPSTAAKAYGIYAKGGTGHGVLTYLRLIETFAG